MKTLAADTSTSINTIAVCDGDRILAETVVECGRKHSERLLATTHWVLGEAGLALADVDVLAVAVGPGSFTGLRIGVAAWKGLAFGARKPLIAVPTLDAMARLVDSQYALACCVLDAKMGEVYGAVYRFEAGNRSKLTSDRVCPIEDLLEGLGGKPYFLGNGALRYRERITKVVPGAAFAPARASVPRGSAVAAEGAALFASGVSGDPTLVVPVYLRKSQAEEKRGGTAPQ